MPPVQFLHPKASLPREHNACRNKDNILYRDIGSLYDIGVENYGWWDCNLATYAEKAFQNCNDANNSQGIVETDVDSRNNYRGLLA